MCNKIHKIIYSTKMININDNTMNLFPFYKIDFNRRKFYNGQLIVLFEMFIYTTYW